MRRIVNSTYVSLDGVIVDPQDWPSPPGEDDGTGTRIQTELILDCDAVLMGRGTYEAFASVWGGRSGDPYTDQINAITKYVVSTTLTDPSWANTVVIDSDPVGEIERLKAAPGKDIVQYGFGSLSHAMMRRGLIDELRLWVHPFFVGSGGPGHLLYRDGPQAVFGFAGAQPLTSGIVVLTYERRA
ncbi:MAG TPA: dihydrofolate reductase family protein [Streptosporangiales bacterium]